MNVTRTLSSANRWRDNYNPLRGLSMARAVSLMEEAQRGVMADLQWLYGSELGIEATDPDLMTIIERTVAGVSDMDWQIATAKEDTRGYDKGLAEEQKAFLESSYLACDNLSDAIEALVMARFRGFAHLQPWLKPDWTIEHLEPLPQWNMVRDGTTSVWAWNPEAQQKTFRSFSAADVLTPNDYILLENRRPVNRIALIKYIRSTISEKDWDAYVEIYGIPGVFIIMPPNIPDGKEESYREAAEDAAEAASGTLPNGSDVKTLAEVRGVQPFQMRLEWLQKQLVLAGTGGMLTMLSEPTGIGGGASGTHAGVWDTIVRRVARNVAHPLNQQYDRRALMANFPGRPMLASFCLRAKQEKDVGSAVTNIAALSTAGYLVDPAQVTAETGYEVTLKPVETAAVGFAPAPVQPAAAPEAAAEAAAEAATALNGAQGTSMVELLKQAASGQVPKESIMPILQAAFPSVAEETLSEIVGPLEWFSAAQAIARARGKVQLVQDKTSSARSAAALLDEAVAMSLAEAAAEALKGK